MWTQINQSWGQPCFQKENCICAATIHVQYIQFLVIYQSVCTYQTLPFLIPTLSVALVQTELLNHNSVIKHVSKCVLVHAQTVYVCHVSMLQIYNSCPWVVTGWLVCDLRWNGTQFIKRGELFLSTKLLYVDILSIVEQAAQKIYGLPAPFLSQALLIHVPSLTHTHAHAHTLKNTIPSLSFFVTLKQDWALHSDGEMMTMAHYPLPEEWIRYIQC